LDAFLSKEQAKQHRSHSAAPAAAALQPAIPGTTKHPALTAADMAIMQAEEEQPHYAMRLGIMSPSKALRRVRALGPRLPWKNNYDVSAASPLAGRVTGMLQVRRASTQCTTPQLSSASTSNPVYIAQHT
jgi:hypothetical protein